MRLYRLLDRVCPRSFVGKVSVVAFLGTHVPLLAYTAAVLALGDAGLWTTLGLLTGATLAGTLATLAALGALLGPVRLVADHLTAWDEGRHPRPLPDGFGDEVGRLMRQANRLLDRATARVGHRRSEAETDPLTGALNRRGAEAWLDDGTPGWLIAADIDRFKAVNDRWGHATGDEVLRDVTHALRAALRPGDMIARWGGEEFLIVLPGVGSDEARLVAERLRQAVEGGVRVRGAPVTVSMGLAPHLAGSDLSATLAQADAALYLAKDGGRNRVCEVGDGVAAVAAA